MKLFQKNRSSQTNRKPPSRDKATGQFLPGRATKKTSVGLTGAKKPSTRTTPTRTSTSRQTSTSNLPAAKTQSRPAPQAKKSLASSKQEMSLPKKKSRNSTSRIAQ